MCKAKKTYYSDMINESSTDQKQIFNTVNRLLHKGKDSPLPKSSSDVSLANRFSEYFVQKIQTIRNSFPTTGGYDSPDILTNDRLDSFSLTTDDEIRKIIMRSPSRSCSLDPLPTWLVKEGIDTFIPILTKLVNTSLQSGSVPASLKKAHVRPLLKRRVLIKKN